jgi:LysM repeat protein
MTGTLVATARKIKHMFECRLDVSSKPCYTSHMRSIEHTFDSSPKGSEMALATTLPRTARPVRTASSARSTRPSAARQSIRLTARGRAAVFFLLSVITLLLVMVAVGGTSADASATSGGPATSSVVVQAGDSLWTIAKSLQPNGDPRSMMQTLVELNGLSSSPLIPGQQLIVPIAG